MCRLNYLSLEEQKIEKVQSNDAPENNIITDIDNHQYLRGLLVI